MARHARFRWWNARECGFFHGRVAVAAVNAQAIDMMFVAEWNRLFARNIDAGRVRRPIHRIQCPAAESNEQQDGGDTGPRPRIATAMKNLRHRFFAFVLHSFDDRN